MGYYFRLSVLLFFVVSVMMSLTACDSQTAASTAPVATPVATAPGTPDDASVGAPTEDTTDELTFEEDTSSSEPLRPLRVTEVWWVTFDEVKRVFTEYSDYVTNNSLFMECEDGTVSVSMGGKTTTVDLNIYGMDKIKYIFSDSTLSEINTAVDRYAYGYDWTDYGTLQMFFDDCLMGTADGENKDFNLNIEFLDGTAMIVKRGNYITLDFTSNDGEPSYYVYVGGALAEQGGKPISEPRHEELHSFSDVDWHSYEAVMATYNSDLVVDGDIPGEKLYRCGEGNVSIIVNGSKTTVNLGSVGWFQEFIYENGVLSFYSDADGTVINY